MALRAGFAQVVITPPVGVKLAGYAARRSPSIGVLDDLYAKAAVLDDGGTRIALVACDLLWIPHPLAAAIRRLIRERAGIGEDGIMVSATHTHCGPDLLAMEDSALDYLAEQIAGAVSAAVSDLADAELGVATGRCAAGSNRRFPRAPGEAYFLYSDPAGTMDETVAVAAFRRPGGPTRAALFSYACHGVTLGPGELRISKDWIHDACETLRLAWGPAAVAIFLQGCAGNVNPNWIYDKPGVVPPPPRVFPTELEPRLREMGRIGRLVGATALAAAESVMSPSGEVVVGAARRLVELPVRRDLPEGLRARVQSAAATDGASPRRYRGIDARVASGGGSVSTEVQAFRIGDCIVAGLPGEVFVEWQIELRRRLAPRTVLAVELANDSINYVPTPEAFGEGGYEPRAAWFAPEAGRILTDAVVEAAGAIE